MKPQSAAQMRASLDSRFKGAAAIGTLDAGQLRRRFVFHRVLRRLAADGDWVLKGGFLLEVRIPVGARATKDLDFVTSGAESKDDFLERLQDALETDEDGDFLVFAIQQIRGNRVDQRGTASWAVTIRVTLDGRTFDTIKLDVAERLGEVGGAIGLLAIQPVVAIDGLGAVLMPAVEVSQHAAEKFHALCLVFPDGRPNTRVKDLVDIALMFEAGLLPVAGLRERLKHVFQLRDNVDPPRELPGFPAAWEPDYQEMIRGLELGIETVDRARAIAQRIYKDAISE